MTEPFWAAAQREVLAVQRCHRCGRYSHPPRPRCRDCGGRELTFEPVSGRGRLWSWTVTRTPAVSGLADRLPYVVALVELAEQPGLLMVTDMDVTQLDGVAIGAPMLVWFDELATGDRTFKLPRWRPC